MVFPSQTNMENLSPQLNRQQLQQNIDALIKQNAPRNVIQNYINKYQQDSTGKFILKTSWKSSLLSNQ